MFGFEGPRGAKGDKGDSGPPGYAPKVRRFTHLCFCFGSVQFSHAAIWHHHHKKAAHYYGPFCSTFHTAGDSDGVPAKVILLEMSYVQIRKVEII